jgi:hypothetical protein
MMTDYRNVLAVLLKVHTTRQWFGYAQIAGIFKQFQVSTGNKTRRNIKRWKDNCSTDTVRKNKSS